jgi:hypothetical protein
MVAAVATLEPEHAAKTVHAAILLCSKPPGMGFNHLEKVVYIRSLRPLRRRSQAAAQEKLPHQDEEGTGHKAEGGASLPCCEGHGFPKGAVAEKHEGKGDESNRRRHMEPYEEGYREGQYCYQ